MEALGLSYIEEVRRVAIARREEIESELELVRHNLRRGRTDLAELERHEELLAGLVALATGEAGKGGKDQRAGLTLHKAMVEVLRDEPDQMLRAGDLAYKVNQRGLYRMRDGRPVEPQQIHARVGHYPDRFIRERTFIKLVEPI